MLPHRYYLTNNEDGEILAPGPKFHQRYRIITTHIDHIDVSDSDVSNFEPKEEKVSMVNG